jgi:hypothetical protein
MNPLAHAVDDYIKLRRGLGFKLKDHEDYFHKFVAFFEWRGPPRITTQLALEFATLRANQKPVSWAPARWESCGSSRFTVGMPILKPKYRQSACRPSGRGVHCHTCTHKRTSCV